MISVLILTLNNNAVSLNFDILCIRNYRNTQMFGNLRPNLCRVTVNSLTSGNNQIVINIAKRTGNRRRCCPCICAAKHAVSNEYTFVCAHSHSFTQNFFCLWKSHSKNCYFRTHFIFYFKCCLQAGFIVRIHNGKHRTSVQCTVRIKYNAALCIRHLFNTYYYLHKSTSYFNKLPEITMR